MILFVLASAMSFLAAVAQGFTGFGMALILTPLLSLIYDPKAAIVVTLTVGLVCNGVLLVKNWRLVQVWRVLALWAAAFVGSLVGVRLLVLMDGSWLRLIIGVVVVAFAVPMFFELRREIKHDRIATVAVGLISGTVMGSTSMGGPPVVLFGLNQNWPKEVFRANMIAYIQVASISTMVLLALAGVTTVDMLLLAARLTPPSLTGLWAGSALFYRVPEGPLRKIITLLVIATGVLASYTGLKEIVGIAPPP